MIGVDYSPILGVRMGAVPLPSGLRFPMFNVLVMCAVVVTLAEWGSLVATRTLEAPSSQRPKRKTWGGESPGSGPSHS